MIPFKEFIQVLICHAQGMRSSYEHLIAASGLYEFLQSDVSPIGDSRNAPFCDKTLVELC